MMLNQGARRKSAPPDDRSVLVEAGISSPPQQCLTSSLYGENTLIYSFSKQIPLCLLEFVRRRWRK
jgi:hypothetical protein